MAYVISRTIRINDKQSDTSYNVFPKAYRYLTDAKIAAQEDAVEQCDLLGRDHTEDLVWSETSGCEEFTSIDVDGDAFVDYCITEVEFA